MNEKRLQQLFEFLKEDSNDPFTRYAIALEYLETQPEKSLQYFENLMADHPRYSSTYYHAAKLYLALGKKEQAEKTFVNGLKICQELGERHAHRELQNAYNEFLFDEDF